MEVNMEELKKVLGKKFDDFFETKKSINFAKDFMEKRIEAKSKLNKKSNTILNKWATDCQAKPDLRLK